MNLRIRSNGSNRKEAPRSRIRITRNHSCKRPSSIDTAPKINKFLESLMLTEEKATLNGSEKQHSSALNKNSCSSAVVSSCTSIKEKIKKPEKVKDRRSGTQVRSKKATLHVAAKDNLIRTDYEGETLYEVEQILGHMLLVKGRKTELLVKWKGYQEQTWEPIENLEQGATELLKRYRKTYNV